MLEQIFDSKLEAGTTAPPISEKKKREMFKNLVQDVIGVRLSFYMSGTIVG